MATIIPISTTTTIAACIQIQVGDMTAAAYCEPLRPALHPAPTARRATIV